MLRVVAAAQARLWSETLGCWLRFNLTTHALRCIDRAGGIDPVLRETPDSAIGRRTALGATHDCGRAFWGGDPSYM